MTSVYDILKFHDSGIQQEPAPYTDIPRLGRHEAEPETRTPSKKSNRVQRVSKQQQELFS